MSTHEPEFPFLEDPYMNVVGEVIAPEDIDGFSLDFTRVCHKNTCRQTVTYIAGQALPHYCELETEHWMHGSNHKRLYRVRITKDWVISIAEQLQLDMDTVYKVEIGPKSVLVSHYQNDENGHRQLAPGGTGVLTYTEEYSVVG